MFLGDTLVIPDEDILFILPREPLAADSRRAVHAAGQRARRAAPNARKTYVITERDGRFAVYVSPISSARLVARNQSEETGGGKAKRARTRKK